MRHARQMLASAIAALCACTQTVLIPVGLEGDGETCGSADAMLDGGDCARSVEVVLSESGAVLATDCIELADGLDRLRDLTAVLASLSFDGIEEGSVVTIGVTVFDAPGCDGTAIVVGGSPPTTLEGDSPAINVELSCTGEGACSLSPIVARIEDILTGGAPDGEIAVAAGYAETSFTATVTLAPIPGGDGYGGDIASGDGCVSIGVLETFNELALVSCEAAVGSGDGDARLAYSAQNPDLRAAFDAAGLAASNVVIGRIVDESGVGVAGAFIATAGEPFYYQREPASFVAAGGDAQTDTSGIFAIRYDVSGCCETISLQGRPESAQAHPLDGSVSAVRLIVADGGGAP